MALDLEALSHRSSTAQSSSSAVSSVVQAGNHDSLLDSNDADDMIGDVQTSLPTISSEIAFTVASKGRQESITRMPQHLQDAFREAVAGKLVQIISKTPSGRL
jgi:hypothetical protein